MRKKKKGDWGRALAVCAQSFRKWGTDPRIFSLFLLLVVFEWVELSVVREFCVEEGLSVSCWYFPFLFAGGGIAVLWFYFGVILLFCDAPFVDNQQMYVILRTGPRDWFLGKIIYVFVASCIYFLLMYGISILELIPYVGFSWDWEMVLTSLAANGSVGEHLVTLPESILRNYSPAGATLLCFLLNVLTASFLGLFIFCINLYKSRNFGAGAALVVVLLSQIGGLFPTDAAWVLNYFSPVSWTSLSLYTKDHGGVPLPYPFIVLIFGSAVLIFIIMRRQRHYNIEAMEEI